MLTSFTADYIANAFASTNFIGVGSCPPQFGAVNLTNRTLMLVGDGAVAHFLSATIFLPLAYLTFNATKTVKPCAHGAMLVNCS